MANNHINLTSPGLQEATKNSTAVWRQDLEALFHEAKDRFPDVVWEVCGDDDDGGLEKVEEIWGHKAIVYARAPPSFQTRYFSFRPSSPTATLPTTSALSLDIVKSGSRTPSPFPSVSPTPQQPTNSLLRLNTSINPALFSNELEYLYTGQGFGEAFEFLFDSAESSHQDMDAEELRIDKLRKDLVFMWRSRLYSDVRISLTGNFSSSTHENTTAIFSSHRFILISRAPYFYDALVAWPSKTSHSEPQTLVLPSPPFTPASLHFTLGFLYTGTLIFSHRSYDLSTAFQILRSALYLSLPTLHDEIQARIVQEMMHGLFHAFLPFAEYERLTGGSWGTGGCRCRQCARRAPRVLEFAIADDVKNPVLERGARRALVGMFGEGWCTSEFAALPIRLRESLLKGVGKRTTPGNVFGLLWAAEHALSRLEAVIDAWAVEVKDMILSGRRAADEVLCGQSETCFAEREWDEIMERDGVAFEDGERVEWIMASVSRGVNERNAPGLYQTLVSSILLRPHPTESDAPMLSSTSHIRVQVEQARLDLLKWIGKRWIGIRQEGGFDDLEGWAIKEISDNLEVPLEDLITPAPRSGSRRPHHHPQPRASTLLRAKETESDSISMHSSMRVSVLSRNLPATTTPTPSIGRRPSPSHVSSTTGTSFKSLPRTSTASTHRGVSPSLQEEDDQGVDGEEQLEQGQELTYEKDDTYGYGMHNDARPDSKLTPATSSIGLPPYSRSSSPTPQPSIIEPREDGGDEISVRYDDDDDDNEHDMDMDEEDQQSMYTGGTSTPPTSPLHNITSISRRSPDDSSSNTNHAKKIVVHKVTPNTTVATRTKAGGSIRPTSSASSIRSNITVSSVRSHASTIRKSTAPSLESSKTSDGGGLRPPHPPHHQKPRQTKKPIISTTGLKLKPSGVSPSSSLRSTPTTRPTSSISNNTSDGSATFLTANSSAAALSVTSTSGARVRRTSTASTASNVSAVSTRASTGRAGGGGGGGLETPTRSGARHPHAHAHAHGSSSSSANIATRTRKTSAGSTKSTFSINATPTKRPPLPILDTNKPSPGGKKKKAPSSITPSVRSTVSTVSSTPSKTGGRKKGVVVGGGEEEGVGTGVVVGKSGQDRKGRDPVVVPVPLTPDVLDEDEEMNGDVPETSINDSSLPPPETTTSSKITVKGNSRVPPVAVDHKKTASTASTGSNSTLKRRGSTDTITTRISGTTTTTTTSSSRNNNNRSSNSNSNKSTSISSPRQITNELKENRPLPRLPASAVPRGAMLDIGIPCIISSKRKRFKAYARYIGEVEGEDGPWVGVEVPVGDSWGGGGGGGGGGDYETDNERQWNDGTWGGIRYFEIGNGGGSEWEYGIGGGGDDRAARRRRLEWVGGGSGSVLGGSKGMLKREGDQLSIERVKRVRSVSPAVSDTSGIESRGLFIRPQQVLYVVDAVGSDL